MEADPLKQSDFLEDNERIDMLLELIRSVRTSQGENCIAESETSEIKQEN
jgi:hypothetical protein